MSLILDGEEESNAPITAAEALKLPRARLTDEEREQIAHVKGELYKHIRKTMTFVGTDKPLDIPANKASAAAMKAVTLEMAKEGWAVFANLMSLPPRFQGASPTPHHWALTAAPEQHVYDGGLILPHASDN